MTLLRLESLSRAFGSGRRRRWALSEIGLEAHAGEVVGVVGPNGAGKTTLLRLIAGELAPTRGQAWVAGHRAGTREGRRAVGIAADPPLAPPELTGLEWLRYLARHRAATRGERIRLVQWALDLGGLEEFAGRRIGEYSRGMAQRLGLAAAALCGGAVVVLDEVLSGIDPLVQRRLRARIAGLAGQGRVIVVASHDLATIERLATRVVVLWAGRCLADLATGALLTERVAELALPGAGNSAVEWVLDRFPRAERTGEGVAVPLAGGLTVEHVLAACREGRIAVGASRVRYRALEDILVAAERRDP
jgi:ABC-type multidrug transport system ATPase subunit